MQLHHEAAQTQRWLPWFDDLGATTFAGADLSMIPRATIIHGTADTIVPVTQAEMLAKALPNAALNIWEDAAHAPHLHDATRLMEQSAA